MAGTLTLYTEAEDGTEIVAPIRIYDYDQNNLFIAEGTGTRSNPWVISLPPSHYVINFLPTDEYDDPNNPDVFLIDGSSKEVVGIYTPRSVGDYAQIEVYTEPIVAPIYLDGSRYGQGYTLITKFPVGVEEYLLSFGYVEGYITPSDVIVSLQAGDSKVVTGTYLVQTAPLGFLTVHTTVDGRAPMHAGVYVDGAFVGYGDGDVERIPLEIGNHVVTFADYSSAGMLTPDPVTVTIQEGEEVVLTRDYMLIAGPLIIDTKPIAGPIYVNGTLVGNGTVALDVGAGTFTISFGAVAGYTTPKAQTVTKEAIQPVYVTGEYIESTVPPDTGMLNVDTSPQGANIFYNGELVGISPVTQEVLPGTYTISFGEIYGYVTPNNITVTVSAGQIVTRHAVYTEEGVPPTGEEGGFPWWLLVVGVGAVGAAYISKRRR